MVLNDQRMLDAEALMKELRGEQQALRDALEAYKKAPDDQKRRLLEDAMREIKKRMQKIMGELAKMQGSIPSEYVNPDAMMCATSRMVVKKKGAKKVTMQPCTLLPYVPEMEMGSTLAEATGPVSLNHPHCAKFCVLGGASCSG